MSETKTLLQTTGMHCPSCAKLIEMSVSDLQGVSSVSVDLEAGTTEVVHDDVLADVETIVAEIERAGYGAEKA